MVPRVTWPCCLWAWAAQYSIVENIAVKICSQFTANQKREKEKEREGGIRKLVSPSRAYCQWPNSFSTGNRLLRGPSPPSSTTSLIHEPSGNNYNSIIAKVYLVYSLDSEWCFPTYEKPCERLWGSDESEPWLTLYWRLTIHIRVLKVNQLDSKEQCFILHPTFLFYPNLSNLATMEPFLPSTGRWHSKDQLSRLACFG